MFTGTWLVVWLGNEVNFVFVDAEHQFCEIVKRMCLVLKLMLIQVIVRHDIECIGLSDVRDY